MNIYKDHWQKYYSLGLIPFPASRKGKNPFPKWGENTIPTKDLFSQWEKEYPNQNIWLRLGDGFAVIDPDGQGAEEFVKSLNLPPCPTSITGNRSIHRWFKVSSPIKPIKATNGGDENFLELRTGSMGMLAPPSIHPTTGKPYKWLEGHSPWDIAFPEFPVGAYERIKALQEKKIQEPRMMPAQTENPGLGPLDVEKYLTHHGIKFKVKQDGQRAIYALERCLFADKHTTKDNEGDSSIIQGPDGKLGYHCFHNHCSLMTWQDARRAISGEKPIAEFCRRYKPPGERKDNQDWLFERMKACALEADQIRVMEFPLKKKILVPWLSERSLILVAGWRGVGKTWFALSAADAISRGIKFGPWETMTPVPTLYIDGEMDIQDIRDRIDSLEKMATEKRKEPFIFYSDFQANLQGLPKLNFSNPKLRSLIKRIALGWQIKLMVLDNIASLCPGIDENSKFDWDPINQWLIDLRFNGISTMLLHHTNKEGGQRGTSAREDNIDVSISLSQPHNYVSEDGADFIVRFKKSRMKASDLSLLGDYRFTLRECNGNPGWIWNSIKKETQIEILRMIENGTSQTEIATILGVTKGYVSRVKSKAMEDNLIGKNGKLTQSGLGYVNQDD